MRYINRNVYLVIERRGSLRVFCDSLVTFAQDMQCHVGLFSSFFNRQKTQTPSLSVDWSLSVRHSSFVFYNIRR